MKPLALDLFCCSGGVTVGLERAGFDVIGVDLCRSQLPKDHPLYNREDGTQHWCGSGEVHMADLSTADAVEGVIRAFAPDFVTSSPPCQRFSTATPTKNRMDHPDLIASTREGIKRTGVPGWIENVATDAVPLTGFWVMLCGIHVGLWNLKRHRRFELIGWRTRQLHHDNGLCMYGLGDDGVPRNVVSLHNGSMGSNQRKARETTGVYGVVDAPDSERARRNIESVHEGSNARAARQRRVAVAVAVAVAGHGAPDAEQSARYKRRAICTVTGENGVNGPKDENGVRQWGQNRPGPECIRWREAMGWLDGPRDRYSLAQAIPPAYAEWLGRRFLEARR